MQSQNSWHFHLGRAVSDSPWVTRQGTVLPSCFRGAESRGFTYFDSLSLFWNQEIDGNALLLLKSDMIMKYLGLKLGPALKLCYHIDKLKQAKF